MRPPKTRAQSNEPLETASDQRQCIILFATCARPGALTPSPEPRTLAGWLALSLQSRRLIFRFDGRMWARTRARALGWGRNGPTASLPTCMHKQTASTHTKSTNPSTHPTNHPQLAFGASGCVCVCGCACALDTNTHTSPQ